MASISDAARQVKVNKKTISYLKLECEAVLERLNNGELGSPTDPKLKELVKVFGDCRSDLVKLTGIGFLFRSLKSGDIPDICESHSMKLKKWLSTDPLRISDAEARAEDMESLHLTERIARIRIQSPVAPVLDINSLKFDEKVGEFPFGTIHTGTYDDKPVYIRKVDEQIKGAHLELIWDSIGRSKRFVDCPNVLFILGICDRRMIVTETTAYGPLSEFSIAKISQKVAIARKIADTMLAMHETAANGERMGRMGLYDLADDEERVIHGDLRAANILIDKGQNGEDDLEPKITGFEMCKQSKIETGEYPHIEECYRKWWSPERKNKNGASPSSEVYAFGMLMYEISTGEEPGDGDPVDIEDMRIHPAYTALMKRCLNERHGARPSMGRVVEELDLIERYLIESL
ncbi:hypothetical protein BGZ50_005523 [Haplosporangium sp. Z 11]|nr:hypothetical protein BGZ50_005523 [Haplosporangium sp. Z 11]